MAFDVDNAGQMLCTVTRGSEVLGFVAIDSLVGGRSCGGLRMLPDVDAEELAALARSMTLKYGFLGLPQGGAKAGVRGDPEAPEEERRARLVAFGEAIAPLLQKQVYVPGTDMGTNNADIRGMLRAVGVRPGRRELRVTDSGYYTALTVFVGAQRAAHSIRLPWAGSRVAIEGFGKVGGALGELCADSGALVVAVSTSRGTLYNPDGLDVPRLRRLGEQVGSRLVEIYPEGERLACAALHALPLDVLCPCARHHSVRVDNAPSISARLLAPGANNPVVPEAEALLSARGVLCLPDFVTNCGGVLGGTMAFAGHDRAAIEAVVQHRYGAAVDQLLSTGASSGRALREIAQEVALRRLDTVRQQAAKPSIVGRVFALGLAFYRQGIAPAAVVTPLSRGYFERRFE
ncbi:MAG: Glu/Leu/Phe/Val family dehydrogenase [Anaerolineae bacterium]